MAPNFISETPYKSSQIPDAQPWLQVVPKWSVKFEHLSRSGMVSAHIFGIEWGPEDGQPATTGEHKSSQTRDAIPTLFRNTQTAAVKN